MRAVVQGPYQAILTVCRQVCRKLAKYHRKICTNKTTRLKISVRCLVPFLCHYPPPMCLQQDSPLVMVWQALTKLILVIVLEEDTGLSKMPTCHPSLVQDCEAVPQTRCHLQVDEKNIRNSQSLDTEMTEVADEKQQGWNVSTQCMEVVHT